MRFRHRFFATTALIGALALGATGIVLAQQGESGNGGVSGESNSNFEVTGIAVDVTGDNAFDAQTRGWREAQRRGWRILYARVNGGAASGAPNLDDSALNAVIAGIIVEEEQIGPQRYVARLGVMFDRARVSEYLGTSGGIRRSPPMLTIPVQWLGGAPQSFEERTPWQLAWLRFRTGGSPIDYVRPSSTGPTPLLLSVGQTGRVGRGWWRFLLDSYGASDVLVPEVHLDYAYPGGPVTARFVAWFGPDRDKIAQFSLRIRSAENLPRLLDEGVRRIDLAYTQALADGRLRPDPTLAFEFGIDEEEIEEELEEMEDSVAATPRADSDAVNDEQTVATGSYTIQVATPTADAVRNSEAAVRGTPGVRSAVTSSLAIGGVSLMQVSYIGDLDTLASALASRGFQVQRGAGTLRISRGGSTPPPPPAPPPPASEDGNEGGQ